MGGVVRTGGDGRLWVLSGPSSSYALRLTDRDELLHLYWGPPITLDDAERLAAEPLPGDWPFESALDGREEYPVEGGPRFARPALALRSAAARGVEWAHEGADAAGGLLRLHFRDRVHRVRLTLHYRMRTGSDVLERWVRLRHLGGPGAVPVEVLRADSATWTLPTRDRWRLSHLHGRWAAESRLVRTPLTPGEKRIGSRRGHTGHQFLPWIALDDGAAGEEHGEVFSAALAWSGSWRICVDRLPDGTVQATGGAGHDDAGVVRLDPGRSWTTPVFAGLRTGGGFGAASRAWHAWQLAHVVPGADRLSPVLYDARGPGGSGAAGPGGLVRRAADIGVELFVVDGCLPGDLTPGRARLPEGLEPLAGEVHDLGMRFGLRLEPEAVAPGGRLHREHPDWVQQRAGRRPTAHRGRLLLDLGRPEVRRHLWERLDALLRDAPVDHVRWDLGRCSTDPGRPGDPWPERLDAEHVEGLYELLDRLREAHPGVTFESCSGGGGRTDLGILARADRVQVSESTDPLDRLAIQHGLSQLHPARVMTSLAADSTDTTLNRRPSNLRFRFVSAMAGVLGVGGDLTSWSGQELAEARDLVALYKRIRHLVQHGELHRLRAPADGTGAGCAGADGPGGDGFSAVQYRRGDGGETAVLAWRHAQRFGTPVPPLRLRGLDRDALYRDAATGELHSGALLAHRGLRIPLHGPLDAAVVHLRKA